MRSYTYEELTEIRRELQKEVENLKGILQDVLSDCYLSDGMRAEIERLIGSDR